MTFVSEETVKKAFSAYLKEYYGEAEQFFSSFQDICDNSDGFPDLYCCNESFLCSKYIDGVEIDGIPYMKFVCWINMEQAHFLFESVCGEQPALPYFEYARTDSDDQTVGARMRAEKKYQMGDLALEEFPHWPEFLSNEEVKKLMS